MRLKDTLPSPPPLSIRSSLQFGMESHAVAKINSIQVLLSLVVHCNWPLYQLDVKNVILNVGRSVYGVQIFSL